MPISVYQAFQKSYLPSSLKGKIMLVAFIGIHLPLLGLIGYVALDQATYAESLSFLLIALVATLVGTALTLWILSGLLKPIELTDLAINNYVENDELPSLPENYGDEAGNLMSSVQTYIHRLDHLLSLKNDIMSIISHDTRNPISSIVMAQQLIEAELDEDEIDRSAIRENAQLIRQSAKQHLQMLDNLLEMARIESSEFQLEKEPTTISEIFSDVRDNHQLRAKVQNISLHFLNSCDETERYLLDQTKIESVLNNLISNALKFTPSGGEVSISAEVAQQNLIFKVDDTGVGIDDSELNRIFDRDYTTSESFKNESGTGLGLWICKEFTDLHGGDISVSSNDTDGTTFTVLIGVNS